MEAKKPWQSKQNWMAFISAVIVFIPVVNEFVSKNPELYASLISGLFMLVNTLTKGKLS